MQPEEKAPIAKQTPFVKYMASAGAGKTHTLVREYLVMALEGDGSDEQLLRGLRSILAITFTNKATAEMKERILEELARMAAEPIDPSARNMGADVLRRLNELRSLSAYTQKKIDPNELSRRAERLFSLILHHYTDLSVSTIDSFTHRIVRTFAHDFGQPMNFDVLIDQQEITDEAMSRLMSLIGTEGNEELTHLATEYAESEMEDDKDYNIERSIRRLAKQLFVEDIGQQLSKLRTLQPKDFRELHAEYAEGLRKCEEEMTRTAQDLLGLLEGVGIDRTTAFNGSKGYYPFLERTAMGDLSKPPTENMLQALSEGKLCGAKASASTKAEAEKIASRVATSMEQWQKASVRRNTYKALLPTIYSVALTDTLDRQMRLYARDNEVIHLSEFTRMINQMVDEDDNPAPFIFERLGNRYSHFLIDEFQDTSTMQWHNLVPLVENGLSVGRSSLVVGDSKQFIYRFRQGDVHQFISLPHVHGMRHHGRLLPQPGISQTQTILQNYRSARAVVDFNNALFAHLARNIYTDNPTVQQAYIGLGPDGRLNPDGKEELRQGIVQKEEGYVQLTLVGKEEAAEKGFEKVQEAIFEKIKCTIEELTQQHAYSQSDICILARTNEQLRKIGAYLAAHSDVRQTSSESFYLTESHAVMAIISVLRLLYDASDRCALTELLSRLEALGLLSEEQCTERFDAIAANDLQHALPPNLDLEALSSLSLYDCCEETLHSLGLQETDILYTASLLNRAASFTARHKHSLKAFLEWFDSQTKLSAAASEDIDAVRLMTIHKSKGLGYPVVICPLLYNDEKAARLWVEPDESLSKKHLPTTLVSLSSSTETLFSAEYQQERQASEVDDLNIMYVAFTRAKECLYIFTPDYADLKKTPQHDRRYPALLHSFAPQGYTVGDASFLHPSKKETSAKKTLAMQTLTHCNYNELIKIAPVSDLSLQPLLEDKRRFGIYAHDLLASILYADEAEEAILRFASERSLQPEEEEELREVVDRVLTDPQTAHLFGRGQEVKTECDMVSQGRHRRPDRVVIGAEHTWVVDFKTGARADGIYTAQLTDYCQSIRKMGYTNVSGHILYVYPEVCLVDCATEI